MEIFILTLNLLQKEPEYLLGRFKNAAITELSGYGRMGFVERVGDIVFTKNCKCVKNEDQTPLPVDPLTNRRPNHDLVFVL